MASRGQYLLRIGGVLKGKYTKAQVMPALGNTFDPPKGALGEYEEFEQGGWPDGFILKGYDRCQWDLRIDQPYDDRDETVISFRAEIHRTRDGSLYGNRAAMIEEVEWFYHYREYKWWKELLAKLEGANKALLDRKELKQGGCMPERLWFKDWQWYCGNSGS